MAERPEDYIGPIAGLLETDGVIPGRRGLIAAGGLAVGASLALAASADAATFTVQNVNDSGTGSLRDALNQANATAEPDTVNFASGLSGTIHLASPLFAGPYSVYIQGPGAGQLTISGDGAVRVLEIGFAGLTRRDFSVSGVTISGGSSSPPPGGIFAPDANLTISNSIITGNSGVVTGGGSVYGGGVGSGSSSPSVPQTLVIDHSTISNNTIESTAGTSFGAGISAKYAQTTITDSTISANRAIAPSPGNDFGGGLLVKGGSAQISRSTIANNVSYNGGGIRIQNSKAPSQITATTITGNLAGNGAGIGWTTSNDPHRLTVTASTIAANGSAGGAVGGGIDDSASTHIALQDSIVSGNTAATGPDLYSAGAYAPGSGFDAAFSLIGNPAGAAIDSTVAGSNISGQSAQLGPLADNGGLVQTMALPGSSPAMDTGAAFGLNTDARGVLRPIDFPDLPNLAAPGADGSDIGAFELQPSNALTLGKLKKNKKKGTAVQRVNLPVPDAGTVTLSGKGLKPQTRSALATGVLKLKLIAKGKAKKALRRKGKAKVKEIVTYSPTGQTPNTLTKKIKLRKRLKRR